MSRHYQFGRSVALNAAVLTAGLVFASSAASAQTPDGTVLVSVNVVDPPPSCSATIAPLVFADLDAGASIVTTDTRTQFDITLVCDKAGTATLTFDGGLNSAHTRPNSLTGLTYDSPD